ncbi:unnamed protein product [Phytomonas sp. Hart1]|nr:unnamed protein product [Phytomonas sp. Hart1]|eukprot:CCW69091.1 unnamed protein product [Phytomonas sp. isolate Hart1]
MKYASPHPEPILFGFIGGSGVYKLKCMQDPYYYEMDTPFGKPSCPICVAKIEGVWCAFLARHGLHHTFLPSEVNYRANICAMKQLGVRYITAVNTVGSLDANYRPGDLALVSQLIDRTVKRESTFFGNGIVAHIEFRSPTSDIFSKIIYNSMKTCFTQDKAQFVGDDAGAAGEASSEAFRVHSSATLVVMEGPAFSTKAESLFNKQSGGNLIGMTSFPEAKLAREAEIAYSIVAMVTDMDSWYDVPHVGLEGIIKVMAANTEKAESLPTAILNAMEGNLYDDPAHHSLENAIVTAPEHLSKETKERMAPLLAKKYPRYAP